MLDFLNNTGFALSNSQKWFIKAGVSVIEILFFLFIGFWLINKASKILTVFLKKAHIQQGMISFLESISKFAMRVILIIFILDMIGVNMAPIIAVLGASLVTIGLALKDGVSNIASGIILIISKLMY